MDNVVIDGVEFLQPDAKKGTDVQLTITKLSTGVHCMHNWYQDWGPNQQRLAANQFKIAARNWNAAYHGAQPLPTVYTEEWARKRIQTGLEKIGKGLVIAAFPSMVPYNKNAALLRESGFSLLGGKCYPNANYPIPQHTTMPKGNVYSRDGYPHWIHIWIKDLGGVENCGPCTYGRTTTLYGAEMPSREAPILQTGFPNCCGLRLRWSPEELKRDPYSPVADMNRYLSICQIPANQLFPKGSWQRFARYKDFKWGVNFKSSAVKKVQDCPHEFNLKKIEEWELAQPLPR